MIREKLEQRPQELWNFKVQKWEIPHLTAQFNQFGLSAQFAKTKSGEYMCLFEKNDEKAIKIARNAYTEKVAAVKRDLAMDRDEEGNFTIKDLQTGQETQFEEVPGRVEMTSQLVQKFGLEDGAAQLVAARFAQEMLNPDEKAQFLGDDVRMEFDDIQQNVQLAEKENPLVSQFRCYQVKPKTDSIRRIAFEDESGNISILTPQAMTKKQIETQISADLQMKDPELLSALAEKAIIVSEFYGNEENENRSMDFEMPLSGRAVHTAIDRNGDALTVSGNLDGTAFSPLTLTISDKKGSVQKLTEMYQKMGISHDLARQKAVETFDKAKKISAQPVIEVQEMDLSTAEYVVTFGTQQLALSDKNQENNVKLIKDKLSVDYKKAEEIAEIAQDRVQRTAEMPITDKQFAKLSEFGFTQHLSEWNTREAGEIISQIRENHWTVPENITPQTYLPERLSQKSSETSVITAAPISLEKVADKPKMPITPHKSGMTM